jgi:hypothetical protein
VAQQQQHQKKKKKKTKSGRGSGRVTLNLPPPATPGVLVSRRWPAVRVPEKISAALGPSTENWQWQWQLWQWQL